MEPEVQIFGKTVRNECREILQKKIPDIKISLSANEEDFILIHREQSWCIFDSSQCSVVELAHLQQFKTLTCGFSVYDTLVLSSSSVEQVVVSLQREIQTITGQVLEPGDYLVRKSRDYSDEAILLCVAAQLLLDQKNSVFEF